MTSTALAPKAAIESRPTGLARWWPALLAVAVAAATWGIETAAAGRFLPMLPLLYVLVAAIGRRSASWPILVVGMLGYLLLRQQDVIDPTAVILAVAVAVTAGGLLLRRTGRAELLLQAGGMVLFAGVALLGLSVAPQAARYVIAAGWLAHGVWDLVHLRRHAVVSRSYAQWCGVVDILMAAELLISA